MPLQNTANGLAAQIICKPLLLRVNSKMEQPAHRYFVVHKPYGMLSQFIGPDNTACMLGDMDFAFPEGIHAIGRLDKHSEGLLLLTTNKRVTKLLFQGEEPHNRTYVVRVKNVVNQATLERLRTGVSIPIQGGVDYITTPCEVDLVAQPENLTDLGFPVREGVPHSWLRITLTEGRFHQIRKMVMAVHHRCQRLIRTSIEDITLGDLPAGGVREIAEEVFFEQLHIRNWR